MNCDLSKAIKKSPQHVECWLNIDSENASKKLNWKNNERFATINFGDCH